MTVEVVEDARTRLELASKFVPRMEAEYGSVFDLISPIQLNKVDDVVKNFAVIVSKPTIGFGVKTDDTYWYIYYLVYHPWDVSFSQIKLFRKLDSHKNDTEGILLGVNKDSLSIDMITVSHNRFLVDWNSITRCVVIESETHAITPRSLGGPGGNYLVYKVFDFMDLNLLSSQEWEVYRESMKPASMPDMQYDSILSSSPTGRLNNRRGDIWNRPDHLFKMLKLKGV